MRAKENLRVKRHLYSVCGSKLFSGSESFTTAVGSTIVYCMSYIHIDCEGTLKKKNKKQKEKKERKASAIKTSYSYIFGGDEQRLQLFFLFSRVECWRWVCVVGCRCNPNEPQQPSFSLGKLRHFHGIPPFFPNPTAAV